LIVQGERDPFGTPEELRKHLAVIPAPVTLHVVERGDHSLAVPKSSGRSTDEVYSDVQDVIANWIRGCR
jgi:predicted alpha/beta-hydrolase family hydrolase